MISKKYTTLMYLYSIFRSIKSIMFIQIEIKIFNILLFHFLPKRYRFAIAIGTAEISAAMNKSNYELCITQRDISHVS